MTVIVTPRGPKSIGEKGFPVAGASDARRFGPTSGRVELLDRERAVASYEAMSTYAHIDTSRAPRAPRPLAEALAAHAPRAAHGRTLAALGER